MNNHNQRRAAALSGLGNFRRRSGSSLLTRDGMGGTGDVQVFFKGVDEARDTAPRLVTVGTNLMPSAGRTNLIKAAIGGFAQISTWYVIPFINDVAVAADLTMTNFEATLDEFVNYTEATRPLWAKDVEASQAYVNAAVLATITADVGGGVVSGVGLVSVNTKNSTAGTIISAVRFDDPRTMVAGDQLSFRYTIAFNAAV